MNIILLQLWLEFYLSLTSPKEPNESWIGVVTKTNGIIKVSILDVKASIPIRIHNFEVSEVQETSNIYAHLNGM